MATHHTNPEWLAGKIRRMCRRGSRDSPPLVPEWTARADEALRGEQVELWQHATVAAHMVTRAALGDDSFAPDEWDRDILDSRAGDWGRIARGGRLRECELVGWRLCRVGVADDQPAGCDLNPAHIGPVSGCVCGWYVTTNRSAAQFHRERGGLVIASERLPGGKRPVWDPAQWQVRKVSTSGRSGYSSDPLDPAMSARVARVHHLT